MTISEIGQPTWYRPDNVLQVGMYLWNTNTLAWERATGGGGVGTDVTVLNFPATQPVSATNLDTRDLLFASDKVDASGSMVTVNAGTNLNTSLLALEAGGNLAVIAGKDFATQTTLAALNTKVTAADTENVTVVSMPTVTVQASNLNIRDLIFAADKVDVSGSSIAISGSVAVTGPLTDAELRAVAVPISGAVTAVVTNTGVFAAQVETTATAEPPEYTEAEVSPLSQDLLGNLRTRIAAVVSDVSPSYIDGQIKPLSLNSEGRLRVSVVPAPDYIEFFLPFDFGGNRDIYKLSISPWSALL